MSAEKNIEQLRQKAKEKLAAAKTPEKEKNIDRICEALKKLGMPPDQKNITIAVDELAKIDNTDILAVFIGLLDSSFKDSHLAQLCVPLYETSGKGFDKGSTLDRIKKEAGTLAIGQENTLAVLQLAVLLKGYEARTKAFVSSQWMAARVTADAAVGALTGKSRLELAAFGNDLAELLLKQLNTHLLKTPTDEKQKAVAQSESPDQKHSPKKSSIEQGEMKEVSPETEPHPHVSSSTDIVQLLNSLGKKPADRPVDLNLSYFLEADQLKKTLEGITQFFIDSQNIDDKASSEEEKKDVGNQSADKARLMKKLDGFIKTMNTVLLSLTEFTNAVERKLETLEKELKICQALEQAIESGEKIHFEDIDNLLGSKQLSPEPKLTEIRALNKQLKIYEKYQEAFNQPEIPIGLIDRMLARLEERLTKEEMQELQQLRDNYLQAKQGSYFSPSAWLAWKSLDDYQKTLFDKLKAHIDTQADALKKELLPKLKEKVNAQKIALEKNIPGYRETINHCRMLTKQIASSTKQAKNFQKMINNDFKGRISLLEHKLTEHIAKLEKVYSGWLSKFIAKLSGKWTVHCEQLKNAKSLLTALSTEKRGGFAAPEDQTDQIKRVEALERRAGKLGIDLSDSKDVDRSAEKGQGDESSHPYTR